MAYSAFGPMPSGVFFTGVATAPSDVVPSQYPVAIAGHPYNIEPKLYQLGVLPIRRDAQDASEEPGENTLSPAGLWRRSQSDWSLGAGQLWLDEPESVRRRFHQSLGIDVFNDREFKLLPATQEKRSSANSNLRLLTVGTRLYVVDGATLIFSNGSGSEQNATWVTGWTTATGLPGSDIKDICFSGSHVYVLGSDNSIYRATPGATAFTLFYNPTALGLRLWFALGRLFMSDGPTLYEISATPDETEIFTHQDPNYTISHVCGAPTGIYISGNIGSLYGELRHTWVREDGAAFVAPVVVAELLNEQINTTVTVGNHIVLGTSIGFRYAPIDGLTTGLDYGPAVEIGPVRNMVAEAVITPDGRLDTFVWGTWSNINNGSNSGLVKIRLTRFTEPGVPAYASDVYSSGGGTVLCVASLSGRRYFGVSIDGFYGATADRVPQGTLSTGRIRYGVLENKIFSDVRWRTSPLVGSVITDITFDNGNVVNAGVQSHAGSVSNDYSSVGPVAAEWGEITFTLVRDAGDTTVGPTLRWWMLRGVPAPEGTLQFIVPIRLTDLEQTPLGPAKTVGVLDEIDFLFSLASSKDIVKYQEGTRSYDVYVNAVDFRADQWDRMDHNLMGICMVELHSTREI